jgi:hypothetical protein
VLASLASAWWLIALSWWLHQHWSKPDAMIQLLDFEALVLAKPKDHGP